MKVTIDSKLLLSTLNQLAPAISKNTVVPALESVLVKVRKKQATLVATNMNITILMEIEVGSEKEFDLMLPFAELQSICKVVVGPMTIENKSSQIVVAGDGNDKFKLGKAEDAKVFPTVPEFESKLSVSVTGAFFNAMNQAKKCLPSIPHIILSNVCIDIRKDSLTVVGTDSLILYSEKFNVESNCEIESLVADTFVNAVKDFQHGEITANEKFICVTADKKKVIVRVAEGKYVRYSDLLATRGAYNITINKNDLEKALDKVLVYRSSLNLHLCDFLFEDGTAKITYYDQDFERGTDTAIFADFTEEIGKIAFNARQLQTLIGQMPANAEEIQMAITSPTSPVFLAPVLPADSNPDGDLLLLIMPIMSQPNQQ